MGAKPRVPRKSIQKLTAAQYSWQSGEDTSIKGLKFRPCCGNGGLHMVMSPPSHNSNQVQVKPGRWSRILFAEGLFVLGATVVLFGPEALREHSEFVDDSIRYSGYLATGTLTNVLAGTCFAATLPGKTDSKLKSIGVFCTPAFLTCLWLVIGGKDF